VTSTHPWIAVPSPAPAPAVRSVPRAARLVRGRAADAPWVRPALLGLLALTALLYVWSLSRSGFANDYYAAAVQAGSQSWKALFFGSFDSANFITVDKTPASLWIPELAARVFGFSSWTLLLPQALMGVGTVGVCYAAVRRYAGPAAGLIAGAVVATTPVAALIFRFDNPDALLVLLLTAAAYAVLRAVESGRTSWLVLAGALVGFGFLTKMLQAFLVLPAFGLAYLVAGPPALGRRVLQLLAGFGAMIAAAGWWVAIVQLTPAADRPFIGGSTTNSILQLTFGYNGFGRITGDETGAVVPGGTVQGGQWGPTGLLRLFNAEFGGQAAWLLPAALLALVAGLYAARRATRTDPLRASLIVWGGWLLVTVLVFSLMSGIFHAYYLVALAPALGALVGTGSVLLWYARREQWARTVLAAGLAGTGVWAAVLLGRTPDWHPWLRTLVLLATIGGAIALLVPELAVGRRGLGLAGIGLVGVLLAPAAYAVSTAAQPHTGAIPTAGPAGASTGGFPGGGRGFPRTGGTRGGFPGGTGGTGGAGGFPGGTGGTGGTGSTRGGFGAAQTVSSAVTSALQAGRSAYTWVAATTSASGAAPYQLAAGAPILAVGGFNGTDQSTTLAAFQQLVAQGRIHYWIGGGGFGGARVGGVAGEIATWVQNSFPALNAGGTVLYDLTGSATTD
jgi:4-amino-4-deoxy-L-arabinose transferase-like glycosyltransferase